MIRKQFKLLFVFDATTTSNQEPPTCLPNGSKSNCPTKNGADQKRPWSPLREELGAMSIHHGQKLHLDTARVGVQLMDHRKPTARLLQLLLLLLLPMLCRSCSGTNAKWVEKQLRKTKPAIMIMPSAERVKDFNVVISGKQKRSATVGAPWNGIFLMPEKRNKLTLILLMYNVSRMDKPA